ncbi:MAG TPA: PfkB family carbohydrate kinase, partial [Vicinamibacterales bacterium]|nr:PfkB family carbohydrate kinase [Vicinamibacterales bacterium]
MTAPPLLSRLAGRTVLIVGDVMLDHFVIGRVDRISPEAPVPVVRFEQEEYRVGGAANVASNVTSLGGHARLVGLTGADAEAARLADALSSLGIDGSGLVEDPARRTTRKLRVVTSRNQQVARIDYENDVESSGTVAAALVAQIER